MRELLLSSRELQRTALRYGIIFFFLKKACPYTTFVVCATPILCLPLEGKVGDVSRSDEVFQTNLNDCRTAINSRKASAFQFTTACPSIHERFQRSIHPTTYLSTNTAPTINSFPRQRIPPTKVNTLIIRCSAKKSIFYCHNPYLKSEHLFALR